MDQVILSGQRLHLRYLLEQDAALAHDYVCRNRHHLAPWEPARDEAYYTLDKARERLLSNQKQIEAGLASLFAVIHNQQMVGICHFSNIVRGAFQACHLGYAIDQRLQGHGYMQEALQLGIGYMFAEKGLHRIMANYLPENQRSGKLLQKLGFEREGYARDYLKINGVWRDHILTALIAPDPSEMT